MIRTGERSPQTAGTVTSDTTTTSVAEKARNIFSVGNNRAYSNRRSRENGCSDGMLSTEDRG